jgi:hypothetical protein
MLTEAVMMAGVPKHVAALFTDTTGNGLTVNVPLFEAFQPALSVIVTV